MPPKWPTLGELSRTTGIPIHRLRYVVTTRRVEPIGMASGTAVYALRDAKYIIDECRRIERMRAERGLDDVR